MTVKSGGQIKAFTIDAAGVSDVFPGMDEDEIVEFVMEEMLTLVVIQQVFEILHRPDAESWSDEHVSEAN